MHFMMFAFKRAHLRSLALVRPWLAPSPITPARYDILRLLHEHPNPNFTQRTLARAVGLSGATISRMLKRLEALGLVKRMRAARDGRAKISRLTESGIREFRRVLYGVLCPGHLHLAFEGALGPTV